jgi:putative aldouronate transport system permease protein
LKKSFSSELTGWIFKLCLVAVCLMIVLPFLNIISVSVSSRESYLRNPLMLFPAEFDFTAFGYVFQNPLLGFGFMNTLFVTVVGTAISLALCVTLAYPLSKKHLRGRKAFMYYLIFTMLFNGGIIPNFYLIRSLNLIDSLWALILPVAVNVFNTILIKTFFEEVPDSLEEAAKIDGASDIMIFTRIYLPLSLSIVVTIALFCAVSYWNSYFSAIIYIRSNEKWTLQVLLREIILSSNTNLMQSGGNAAEYSAKLPTEAIKYATLVIVLLPILCVYPFLQKYFVKGVMVGAVKG